MPLGVRPLVDKCRSMSGSLTSQVHRCSRGGRREGRRPDRIPPRSARSAVGPRTVSTFWLARGPKAIRYVQATACSGLSARASSESSSVSDHSDDLQLVAAVRAALEVDREDTTSRRSCPDRPV